MNWTDMARDEEEWQAVVNMEMNFPFPLIEGNFLTDRVIITFSRTTPLKELVIESDVVD